MNPRGSFGRQQHFHFRLCLEAELNEGGKFNFRKSRYIHIVDIRMVQGTHNLSKRISESSF